MDDMTIKSDFSCMILSRALEKIIEKKIGPGIGLSLSDVHIWKEENGLRYHLSANISAEVNNKAMEDLICKKRDGSGTS